MDINISANTLFHFTTDKKALLSILANGLFIRYSLENFENLINGDAEIVFPMVSFCDIPLSQIKRHTSTYGGYAIGLTKSWGMANKINPVIYTYPKSTTAETLNEIVENLESFFDINTIEFTRRKPQKMKANKKGQIDLLKALKGTTYQSEVRDRIFELQYQISHFLKYIKPYEGRFYRGGKYLSKPVKFYEEREWRFCPPKKFFDKVALKDSYKAEYYTDPIRRRAINIRLARHIKLNFKASDIRFIIVPKDEEIPSMLEEIERVFGQNTTHNDLKLLGTRLISLEQILEDL